MNITQHSSIRCLLSAMMLAIGAWGIATAQTPAAFPGGAVPIAPGVYPMVDASLFSEVHDLQHRLHEPMRREVVLTLDRPWEGIMSGYGCVMRDEAMGEFRMFYRGGGDIDPPEVTCIATSPDGIVWERPALSLFSIDGITTNNVVWTAARPSYGESHNFSPFIDANPACAPDARYKAVALQYEETRKLGAWASPDGIRWRRLRDEAIISQGGGFDSLNVAFWDPNIAQYVCYSRVGANGLRSIQRSVSPDFLNWSEPAPLVFRPPQTDQYYTNGVTLYPRSPRLYLALPMRFVPGRKTLGQPPRETDGLSDAVLLTSRDGQIWRRTFPQAFIRPGLEPGNWGEAHGNQTPLTGILQTGESELSIYWFENYVTGTPRIRRGTLRFDGFASLHAGAGEGEMITAPMTIAAENSPAKLLLNISTSAAGSVRVEVQDLDNRPLPEFALADCDPIWGDEIARPVVWKAGDTLPAVNQPFRLRFVLSDADLFAFEIR